MPAGQRRVPDMLLSLKFLSSDGLIMTSLQNSVLKISISFFVKFSKNSKILKYPSAALVYFAKPIIVVPAKNHQRKSLIQPNSKRKPKSRSLLILKKCQRQNITKWVIQKATIKLKSL